MESLRRGRDQRSRRERGDEGVICWTIEEEGGGS